MVEKECEADGNFTLTQPEDKENVCAEPRPPLKEYSLNTSIEHASAEILPTLPSSTPQFQEQKRNLIGRAPLAAADGGEFMNACQPYRSPFARKAERNNVEPVELLEKENASPEIKVYTKEETPLYEELPLPQQVAKARCMCTPQISRNRARSVSKSTKSDIKSNSEDFLDRLDEEVRRSEETMKMLNARYNMGLSPNFKKSKSDAGRVLETRTVDDRRMSGVPVFETSICGDNPSEPSHVLQHSKDENADIIPEISHHSKPARSRCFAPPTDMNTQTYVQEKENESSLLNGKYGSRRGYVRQTDALLTLEITLRPGLTIRLEVTRNDTPSYLAEKCLAVGKIHAGREVIRELSKVIEQNIELEIRGLMESIKRERIRAMKENAQKEKEKKEREVAAMRPFDLRTEKLRESRPKVLGRLSILIGNNRKGEIVIREGDYPESLVNSFIATYSLKQNIYPTIMDAVNKLIETARKERPPARESEPVPRSRNGLPRSLTCRKPSKSREREPAEEVSADYPRENIVRTGGRKRSVESQQVGSVASLGEGSLKGNDSRRRLQQQQLAQQPNVLFKVNFMLMDGRKSSVSVKQKDNLYRLAHNFVVTHKLGEEMLGKVWETLQESYKVRF